MADDGDGDGLTAADRVKYTEAFNIFDKHQQGYIPWKPDFANLWRAIGQNPTEADLKRIIEENDTGTGHFQLETFLKLCENREDALRKEQLIEAFKTFDKDGKGTLTIAQIRYVLMTMGDPLNDEEADRFIDFADKNKEGPTAEIDYEELVERLDVVDIIFLIDMALQFLTGYHERLPNSRYVKDFRKIAYRYVTGWFFIDLTSSLPYQFLSTYPAARLLRLLRLHRAPSIVRQHQSSIGVSFAILSLSKFYVACIWASIAWNSENSENSESGSWLQALESSKGGPASLYSSWLNVYTISLYWAIMTLTSIGYGDITPQNGTEYIVACCCMAVMSSMWAVVIGQMCGVLATLLPHDVAFKRTMDDLNWMMRDRGMPKHLRSKLRRYFWESRSLTRLMEQRKVIERMSPMLQGVVARQLSEQWLSKVRYLQLLDQETLVAVARKLTPQLFAPHEAIEKQRTLFVVRRGVCMHGGRVLVAGSLWGEDMLVSNDALREHYSVRCLTYLEVLSLRYPDFQIAVQSEKSRRIIRWWQIRLSLTHGVKKIADQVRQLHAREKAQFDTLRWEDRRSLLARILRGDNIQSFARKSTTCSSNSKSSEIGTEVEPAPSVLVASEEFESMKQAIIHLTKTVEQLQQTVLERSG